MKRFFCLLLLCLGLATFPAHAQSTSATISGGVTRIDINVEYCSHSVCLSVKDNGIGSTPSVAGPGFGLRGMRKRTEEIAAKMDIASTLGHGSAVSASASIAPSHTLGDWVSSKLKEGR